MVQQNQGPTFAKKDVVPKPIVKKQPPLSIVQMPKKVSAKKVEPTLIETKVKPEDFKANDDLMELDNVNQQFGLLDKNEMEGMPI